MITGCLHCYYSNLNLLAVLYWDRVPVYGLEVRGYEQAEPLLYYLVLLMVIALNGSELRR